MTTIISPNIKKISERIDPAGNIINARTKEIIKPVEPEYVPPGVSQGTPMANPYPPKLKIDNMINNLVEKKVAEIVTRKVEEALKNL